MIHTITLNPSLDYFVGLPELKPGSLHRSEQVRLTAGGKGINVAMVLQRLGYPVLAHGFAAGATGRMLEEMLRAEGLPIRLVHTDEGMTRINVKVIADTETEINGAGPEIHAADFAALSEQVLYDLQKGDGVILSGSACRGVNEEQCAELLEHAVQKGAFTAVDVSGPMLHRLVQTHPFCVKPNEAELTALYGENPENTAQLISCAERLQQEGARQVLVSRGAKGALLVCEDGRIYEKSCCPGTAKGTVGAGDSMVAGFLSGWLHTGKLEQALESGIAAGCATAFAGQLCNREQFDRLYRRSELPL